MAFGVGAGVGGLGTEGGVDGEAHSVNNLDVWLPEPPRGCPPLPLPAPLPAPLKQPPVEDIASKCLSERDGVRLVCA